MAKQARSTFERVKAIIGGGIFLVSPEDITPNADLVEDLGFDSLDFVELAMALEEEFQIMEITDEEMEPVKTVADVVELMERKTS